MIAVYILTNRPRGSLYTGVTADMRSRAWAHKHKRGSAHAAKYNLTRLVYVEEHWDIATAIAREKVIKRWRRQWKIELIEGSNPNWRDLSSHLGWS